MIRDRYNEIIAECGLHISLDKEFDALWDKMKNGISQDELASRGEYFSARLMAEYLGYEFLDAAEWVKFRFDGTVDTDATYEALHRAAGGKDAFFALDAAAFSAGASDAAMLQSRALYRLALERHAAGDGAFPTMDAETLTGSYPGLAQSMTQVLHAADEQANKWIAQMPSSH